MIVYGAMNDLIRPCLYQSYHHVVPAIIKNQAQEGSWDIVGPVCESSDFFAKDYVFTTATDEGDWLAILSAGAYGFSMSSQFNSRPRVAEYLVQDNKFVRIRKREIYEDLIQGEFYQL